MIVGQGESAALEVGDRLDDARTKTQPAAAQLARQR
jgi:hypothetical protein